MKNPLVTTHWLKKNLSESKLVLLDASMEKVIGKKIIEYDQLTLIPGSKKLDLENTLCDLNSSQTHAFPTAKQFSLEAQKLGIKSDTTIVIYDNQGVYSSPRAWWIFQAMGFTNVFVLDGGLPKWIAEKREVMSEYSSKIPTLGDVEGRIKKNSVCNSKHIMQHLSDDILKVIDARSNDRFLGVAPEPRPGVRSGHIPHSINLPFADVLDGDCFKEKEELLVLFKTVVRDDQQLIFSCGSGVTACIILLASRIAGYQSNTLYDGSWADWGSNDSLPIAETKVH